MTIKPLTIEEILAKGGLAAIPVMSHTDEQLSLLGKAADEIETGYTAEHEPRSAGRPRKESLQQETAVRGLRLRITTWRKLEFFSKQRGSSVNRLIEEAVNTKLYLMVSTSPLPEIETNYVWEYLASHYANKSGSKIDSFTYELAKAG